MKSLTVQLPDDVYDRAERRAGDHGATLSSEVADFVVRYAEGTAVSKKNAPPTSAAVSRLLAALDVGRNVESISPFSREELYDRPVPH